MQCMDEACGCCNTLVVRDARFDIILSQTEVPFYWGTAQTAESNTYYYRCDQRENELYLWAKLDTISALDGDTGQFVRNFTAQDIGEYWFFEIQPDADRLLLFDRTNDKIWVWRLSTAEHLGTIDVVPGFYDCVIQDADHLVCTGYDPAAQPTATYVVELIDLLSLSIERIFPTGNYYLFSHQPFAMKGNRAIVSGWTHDKKSLFMFDFATGEVTVPLKDFGNLFAMPDLDRVFVTWTDPDTKRRRWSLHSFPDFAEIKTGDDPPPAESVYLPKRKLLLQYMFGRLFIFDPVEGKYLDNVNLCDSGDYWFRVDATERYAGTLCHGDETREEVLRGIRPRGAGVAVLDLSRYFAE